MKVPSLKIFPAKAKSLIRKKPLVVAVVSLVLIVASLAAVMLPADGKTKTADAKSKEQYQRELIGAVDTSLGAPKDGRDPASQPQNSLASAASKPDGPGQRTDKPAANVKGGQGQNNSSSNDAAQTGMNSAGCFYEYGKSSQCVPAHAATNGKLTCDGVRTHGGFPNGVSYSKDRFGLDKNRDGTACGNGD